MRRSLALRIVALVALLGLVGLVSSGCTGVITLTFWWGPDGFFDRFVHLIGEEKAYELGNGFYASAVTVEPLDGGPAQEFSRAEIIELWEKHFGDYVIESSGLHSVNKKYKDEYVAIFDVERYEYRRDYPYGPLRRADILERYTLHKIGGEWRIVGVWERSLSVYPL